MPIRSAFPTGSKRFKEITIVISRLLEALLHVDEDEKNWRIEQALILLAGEEWVEEAKEEFQWNKKNTLEGGDHGTMAGSFGGAARIRSFRMRDGFLY